MDGITGALREWAHDTNETNPEVLLAEFDRLCDQIDAIDRNLAEELARVQGERGEAIDRDLLDGVTCALSLLADDHGHDARAGALLRLCVRALATLDWGAA